jgi:hypothetical protein
MNYLTVLSSLQLLQKKTKKQKKNVEVGKNQEDNDRHIKQTSWPPKEDTFNSISILLLAFAPGNLSRLFNLSSHHIDMKSLSQLGLWVSLASSVLSSPTKRSVHFKGPFSVDRDSVHNIHIVISEEHYEGELRVVYGNCDQAGAHERHHEVSHVKVEKSLHPERLVWIVPREISQNGCLHAYSGETLVGRSVPISVTHSMRKRQSITDVADTSGPWFDGVAYLASKNQSTSVTAAAKAKKIAIVGGGMSGLMTSLLLTSVGITDWHIHESSERVGGRVRTKYLNGTTPSDYQYQEMGPMRFPVSVKYADTNEIVDINGRSYFYLKVYFAQY